MEAKQKLNSKIQRAMNRAEDLYSVSLSLSAFQAPAYKLQREVLRTNSNFKVES